MPPSSASGASRTPSHDQPASPPPSYTSRPAAVRKPQQARAAASSDVVVDMDRQAELAWRQYSDRLASVPAAPHIDAPVRPPAPVAANRRIVIVEVHSDGRTIYPPGERVPEAYEGPNALPAEDMPLYMYEGIYDPAVRAAKTRARGNLWYGAMSLLLVGGVIAGAVVGTRNNRNGDDDTSSAPSTTPAPTASTPLAPGLYEASGARVFDNCTSAGWGLSCQLSYATNLSFAGTVGNYRVQDVSNQMSLTPQPQAVGADLFLLSPYSNTSSSSDCLFRQQTTFDLEITGSREFAHKTTFRVSNAQTGQCADVSTPLFQLDQVACHCDYIGGSTVVG